MMTRHACREYMLYGVPVTNSRTVAQLTQLPGHSIPSSCLIKNAYYIMPPHQCLLTLPAYCVVLNKKAQGSQEYVNFCFTSAITIHNNGLARAQPSWLRTSDDGQTAFSPSQPAGLRSQKEDKTGSWISLQEISACHVLLFWYRIPT